MEGTGASPPYFLVRAGQDCHRVLDRAIPFRSTGTLSNLPAGFCSQLPTGVPGTSSSCLSHFAVDHHLPQLHHDTTSSPPPFLIKFHTPFTFSNPPVPAPFQARRPLPPNPSIYKLPPAPLAKKLPPWPSTTWLPLSFPLRLSDIV
ncbi:hypothetical protein BDZ85DRAFT_27464 [Elsinoe ampelina]|uniref:Uncharacterized protein n=1 Tax=Elsinoe ampelina TaxID=302913 RepID=A0A6A6G4X3_9PEZI|nr:hypothetical protein BDZ85DRAFT_27464 [Elsinoe ampelina]